MWQVFLEGILVMVIVFSFPGADFQRTMTICAVSLSRGNLGHGHRLFLFLFCFSLHSCRSSLMNFLIFVREIWRKFCRIFSDPQILKIKAPPKKSGTFRSIFREKIRALNKIFRANFVLQTCRPKFLLLRPPRAENDENVAIGWTGVTWAKAWLPENGACATLIKGEAQKNPVFWQFSGSV